MGIGSKIKGDRIHTQSIYSKGYSTKKQFQFIISFYIICIQDKPCTLEREMDWVYPKRGGPEWKQSWTTQTLHNVSCPPLPLLAVFAIVIFLLSVSQYTAFKSELDNHKFSFQFVLLLVPVLLIFLLRSSLIPSGRFNFWGRIQQPRKDLSQQSGASPWGVAILLVVLLILVSYQSSFHSKWFGLD